MAVKSVMPSLPTISIDCRQDAGPNLRFEGKGDGEQQGFVKQSPSEATVN